MATITARIVIGLLFAFAVNATEANSLWTIKNETGYNLSVLCYSLSLQGSSESVSTGEKKVGQLATVTHSFAEFADDDLGLNAGRFKCLVKAQGQRPAKTEFVTRKGENVVLKIGKACCGRFLITKI